MARFPEPAFTLHELPMPPGAITYLSQSNAVPEGIERILVRSYIDELESQLHSVQEGLVLLQLRQEKLRETIQSYKAPLSPVRRLPPEILGLIFSFVTPKPNSSRGFSMCSAPWLFTRVCRFWSAVALSTPALWSRLDLHLDGMGENGAIPLAQLQIQRSQNMPLTVIICHSSYMWLDSHLLLDVALSASERWAVADIHMHPILLQEMAKGFQFQSLTALDISVDLSVDDRFDRVSKFDDAFWSAFSLAPKLRDLRALSSDWDGFINPPFVLPWAQLTRLTTSSTSNTEALTVLGKLSNVTECMLVFAESNTLPPDHHIVRLLHLCTLSLQTGSLVVRPHTSILDFLETPSLTSLAVYGAGDADAVISFVTRSDCANSLTSLQLRSSTINHDTALCLTEKLSCLTCLELGDFDGTLLSRSSTMSRVPAIPDFVRAFIDQWLNKRKVVTDLPPLNLLITDKRLGYLEVGQLTSMLSPLRKTGLVVTISQTVDIPDIISEPFLC
ncbi:hypothetical protein R3P38DRAFT_2879189 [Favolaschia claudopus]|uniref:F-box domain-containing protein n=1 Tax=Favolaschia claudopus TaxID=2862362 RepID=A0AAW0D124_9AGAR